VNSLPVSTSTSPSPVVNALTLANAGRKATPSSTGWIRPVSPTGWCWVIDASPRQSWSASVRMSVVSGIGHPCCEKN
jgi:hypothetical protein